MSEYKRVFVYFNLHKKLWSVKSLTGDGTYGRVIAHRRTLTLTDATPKVSEKGRQRVLREGRKNVHAGVVGNWYPDGPEVELPTPNRRQYLGDAYYNPYVVDKFKLGNDDWEGSDYVVLTADQGRKVMCYEYKERDQDG